jgi:PAS domain S-box-containing protein
VSYILGYEPEDVIGKTPFDLMPAEEAKRVAEILGSLVAERKPINYLENINLHKDGRQVILETCGVPFFDRAGIFIGYRGVDRDITERKRAEEAKNRLYEEIKDLYNNAPCGYHSIDAEGAFTRINDTELDWLGYAREEVIGRKRFIDIISLVSRDQYARTHPTLKKNGSPKEMELDLVRKDGTILNALLSELSVRDAGGNLVSSRATIHDISERKKLEEQLRQSQKMESIGLLAGGVAHDFNNILTAMYGYCAILQSKMGEDSPFRSEIDHIQAAAERAASLTRSLLAFSRQQIMKPQQVNLNDIVKNIWQLLIRIIGEDIHLETNIAEMPLWIFADSVQIEQVLMNLAANARDAMPNGGQLTIETEVREIDEGFMHIHGIMAPGEYAVISLSDNGIGMDAETSKKIFEPFFTTKEAGKGTGLGLSIVYGVIKQHNGYISVYSEPGLGTTFRIYLPITKAEHVSEERGVSLPPKGGTETILCAEDDDAIRALVTLILRSYGYNVITAVNGADAVSMFMEHKDEIDLLLLDLIMPKKNGKEASDEIRKLHPGLRTLFMTGYPSDFLQKRGMLEESPDVVIKPISPMDLLRKIREVLDR